MFIPIPMYVDIFFFFDRNTGNDELQEDDEMFFDKAQYREDGQEVRKTVQFLMIRGSQWTDFLVSNGLTNYWHSKTLNAVV